MQKLKYNLFIFLTLLTLFSFTKKKVKNRDFILISATKQTTYGGVAGSPVITKYLIKVRALHSLTLSKDSAFAEGKIAVFEIQADSFTTAESKILKKGETATIGFAILTSSELGGGNYQTIIPGSPIAKAPVASKMGVVLRYKGGSSRYLDIDKIKTLETFYAP